MRPTFRQQSSIRGAPARRWRRRAVAVLAAVALGSLGVTAAWAPMAGAVPGPKLTAVSPTDGPLAGGVSAVLTGSNLTSTDAVHFGTVDATAFTVISATQVTATVPPASVAGPVQVTVHTPSGTSTSVTYTYLGAPVLDSVTPATGPGTGGTTVVLSGHQFGTTSRVHFGSVELSDAAVTVDATGTHLTVLSPAGTGTVWVQVSNGSTWSAALAYTYYLTPVLTGMSPLSGPQGGGTQVTLTGGNLGTTSAVHFGAAVLYPAMFAVNAAGTQLYLTSPAWTGTSPVAVYVVNPYGTSSPQWFSYTTAVTPKVILSTADCTPGNQRFVCQAYLDLLNRLPDSAGLDHWTTLMAQGVSAYGVALSIQLSPEHLGQVVATWYGTYLHRVPSASEVAYWVSALQRGATYQVVQAHFLGSAEYYLGPSGGTAAGFLTALYSDVLGRAPDAAGASHWLVVMAGSAGTFNVAQQVLGSPEYLGRTVAGWYVTLLDRTATPGEVAGWVTSLQGGTRIESVVSSFVGSTEYYGKFAW